MVILGDGREINLGDDAILATGGARFFVIRSQSSETFGIHGQFFKIYKHSKSRLMMPNFGIFAMNLANHYPHFINKY